MPNYDVDVHFEYKKYVPKIASCEDRCPCDDEVDFIDPREGRDPNPRKLLVFREHIHDTEMEERDEEFEESLPKTAGIICEYEVGRRKDGYHLLETKKLIVDIFGEI